MPQSPRSPRPAAPRRMPLSGALAALISLSAMALTWPLARAGTLPPAPAATPMERGPEQMATASPTPWLPNGSWQTVHGPKQSPLWTSGEGRQAMTCGEEDGTAGSRGSPAALCAVHGLPDQNGDWTLWAVGERGMLARYQEGRWTRLDDLSPAKTSPRLYNLHDVHVLAPDDVWAVGWVDRDPTCISEDGTCGVVLHYDGESWQAQDRARMGISGCMARLNAIDLQVDAEGTVGWAVGDRQCGNGGALYLNYDGARWRWTRVPQASRDLHDVKIVHRRDVWAVGEFGIESHFYEPKANPAWSVLGKSGADDLFALDLADTTYGWDGGDNGRLNRYVGTCHDDDQNTQCWFDNQASPVQNQDGQKQINDVYGIDLLSRGQGWLVGKPDGRQSFVAHFSHEKRWRSVPVAGDTGESLFGLLAASADWAIAVGDEGTIIEYRAEAAPTASSGPTSTATWTPQPSPSIAPSATAGTSTGPSPTATPNLVPSPTMLDPTVTATLSATPTPSPGATAEITPSLPPSVTAVPWKWKRIWLPQLVQRRSR